MTLLPLREACDLAANTGLNLDADTLGTAARIVDAVRIDGEAALRRFAAQFDGLAPEQPLWLDREALQAAAAAVPEDQRQLLERTKARIAAFAERQRAAIQPFELRTDHGALSQRLAPVDRAGCYAPGGRFPLPSSVLMTAVTARTAGVREVFVASPRPQPITLAAAAVAGADGFLCAGGAQAIAALAFGAGSVPRCDVLCGPGNRFVTAAKQLVAGQVGVDLPAGPSELCVLADDGADAGMVAADLLAQAEHDQDARVVLVTTHAALVAAVHRELAEQLAALPDPRVAQASLQQGAACVVHDLDAAVQLCDRLAPEHLQLCLRQPDAVASRLSHYGALFLGRHGAEVFGDYGAGPNHVLPTAGAARFTGGLSVLHFLRVRTWLRLDRRDEDLQRDAVALARLEGLHAHAAAALRQR